MKIELARANEEMEELYYDFINEWENSGEAIVPDRNIALKII